MKYLGAVGPCAPPQNSAGAGQISETPEVKATEPVATAHEARTALVAFGLILVAFWPTFVTFPAAWNAPSNEHGFVVVGLVAWLIWRDRRTLFAIESEGLLDLLPVLMLGSAAWLVAVVAGIGSVHQAALPVLITLWAIATFGWVSRRTVFPIGLTFMLAVPIWTVVIPPLQRITTIVSGGVTQLAGITAEVGYDTITLTTGTFLVEAGCSGLNYLMGALVLGAMYAQLFVDRWQTQLKVIALAAGASILGNWIRVTMLIFIGEASAMQSPMLEDHLWQGWWIFTLLMVPTYFLAQRIERRDEAVAADLPILMAPPVMPPVRHSLRNRRAVLAALAVLVGPFVYMAVGAIPRGAELDRGVEALHLDPSAVPSPLEARALEWLPDFHGVDERVAWSIDQGGEPIQAARHYFQDQSFGEELIQFGNFIAPDTTLYSDRMIGPIGAARRFAHEAIVVDADGPRVVWYWYRVAGFDTAFPNKAKLLEVIAFFRRSPASELITLTARCTATDCTAAANALRSAMGVPVLPEQTDP